jgi:hypothetical protein
MADYPTSPIPQLSFTKEIGFKTLISQFENGAEQRRRKLSQGKRLFTLVYNALTVAEAAILWNFYMARKGSYESFNFIDPAVIPGDIGSLILTNGGSTFNRGDFTVTGAFFWSSLDLSAYHGTDVGSTPFYIEVLDGTGLKATGYIGAVGAGETVIDKVTGDSSTFTGGVGNWVPEGVGTITAAGGKGILTPNGSYAGMIHLSDSVWGRLNKFSLKHRLQSGTAQIIQVRTPPLYAYSFTPTGTETQSPTVYKTGDTYTGIRITDAGYGGDGVYEIDDIVFQQVTDPPVTAVHIVSSLNGTIRNWASIESGFDPNTITSWGIYDVTNAYTVRFLEDKMSYENFTAAIIRTGLKLIQVL